MQNIFYQHSSSYSHFGWTNKAIAASAAMWRRLMTWRNHRRAIKALNRLDDRMLDDIGIDRCEIETMVANGRER